MSAAIIFTWFSVRGLGLNANLYLLEEYEDLDVLIRSGLLVLAKFKDHFRENCLAS